MKKLSEMNTVEMTQVLCRIAEPAATLFADNSVADAFAEAVKAREAATNHMQFFTRCIAIFAPVILDRHRDEVFAILAAIKGVSVEEINAQPGMQTVREIVEMLTADQELTTFFRPDAGGKAQ